MLYPIVLFSFQVRLPFSSLRPVFRARTVTDSEPFDPSNIISLQACLSMLLFLPIFFPSKFTAIIGYDKFESLQLMYSKFEYDGKLNPTFLEGEFQLPISSILAYIKDPVTPRYNNFFCSAQIFYYICM